MSKVLSKAGLATHTARGAMVMGRLTRVSEASGTRPALSKRERPCLVMRERGV